jgi:hypothetical protein
MAWHAVFPDGTFVPSGRYDLWLDGKDFVAKAGDPVSASKNSVPGGRSIAQSLEAGGPPRQRGPAWEQERRVRWSC